MKLRKLFDFIDHCDYCYIWTQDDDEAPAFEGFILDVPWYLADAKLNTVDNTLDSAIHLTIRCDKNNFPAYVINVLLED